jgi:integrase
MDTNRGTRVKLDARSVAALAGPDKGGGPNRAYWDSELGGFVLRVSKTGRRSYLVSYYVAGKRRTITLGTTASLTAREARLKAAEIISSARLGYDKRLEIDARKAALRAQWEEDAKKVLFQDAWQRYRAWAERHGRGQQTLRTIDGQRRNHLRPFEGRDMRAVTRHEISNWLTGLAEIGEPTAVMYHTRINAFFNFLVREDGTLDKNPMVGMTMLEVASRDRLLSERELRAAWHLAPAVHPVFGNAFRFLTLSALRRLEALNLQWDEFNDDDPAALHFDIAGERIKQRGKNKKSFVVPLSAPALAIIEEQRALAIIEEQRALANGSPYVFPSTKKSIEGNWDNHMAALRKKVDAATGTGEDWRAHDLRRTFSATMKPRAVSEDHVEMCLAHATSSTRGVAGVYNKYKYFPEKKAVLDGWADHVMQIVAA